jgi:phosphatidylglycerophosphate synthase
MALPATVIIGDTRLRLWSQPAATRLGRMAARAGAGDIKALSQLGADEPAFLVRADTVIEQRLAASLIQQPGTVLTAPSRASGAPVALAAMVHGRAAALQAAQLLEADTAPEHAPEGLSYGDAEAIGGSYDHVLRKQAVPFAERLGDAPNDVLERLTFGASYKGATDFVTKYAWPWPARHVTRWCAKWGLTPNQVTTVSLILMFLAMWGFCQGQWWIAIPLAWMMTFLDTVDGKLARVTMNSSKFGNYYDHGIDLIHPPFWWWAWAVGAGGMAAARGPEFVEIYDLALWVIVVGYVVQRIYEGAFLWLFKIEGHIWRPFDFAFRSITARRNPNLFILMISAILGVPDYGLIAVAAWVAICMGVHFFRLGQAALMQQQGRSIRSYLQGG